MVLILPALAAAQPAHAGDAPPPPLPPPPGTSLGLDCRGGSSCVVEALGFDPRPSDYVVVAAPGAPEGKVGAASGCWTRLRQSVDVANPHGNFARTCWNYADPATQTPPPSDAGWSSREKKTLVGLPGAPGTYEVGWYASGSTTRRGTAPITLPVAGAGEPPASAPVLPKK
jgi:hypothetical protein